VTNRLNIRSGYLTAMRCHHCAERAVYSPTHRDVRVGVCGSHLRVELRRLRQTATVLAGDLSVAQGAK